MEDLLAVTKEKFPELDITRRHLNRIVKDNQIMQGVIGTKKVKEYINLNNDLLYSIPYQNYTNAIENFFSILKSKLYKLNGYEYEDLKNNISKAIINLIGLSSYKNILRGAYERENYVKKRRPISRKIKKYKD